MNQKNILKKVLNILIILGVISIFYFSFKADAVNPSKHELTKEEVQLFSNYHLRLAQSHFLLFILIIIKFVVNKKKSSTNG